MSAPAQPRLTAAVLSESAWEALGNGGRTARLLGASGTSAHVDVDGFVLTILPRNTPLLPNAIAVRGVRLPNVGAAGASVVVSPEGIGLPGAFLTVDPSVPRWDPSVAVWRWLDGAALTTRGTAILGALGLRRIADAEEAARAVSAVALAGWDDASRALNPLFEGVATGRPGLTLSAAVSLLGAGTGLTPEGDDILVATLLALASARTAAAVEDRELRRWRTILCPSNSRQRTTTLSATLLRLAALGRGAQPLVQLLDPGQDAAWPSGLEQLCGIGHSTGRVYAVAAGAAMSLLGRRVHRV